MLFLVWSYVHYIWYSNLYSILNSVDGSACLLLPAVNRSSDKLNLFCNQLLLRTSNKSWVVTEMGDRLATVDIGRKEWGCCAPFRGAAGPHLTQCGLGRDLLPYQMASWSIQLFGYNTWAKVGGAVPPFLRGEWGPHLTHCCLGWDLSPYQMASWSIQPLDHNRHGPKIRGGDGGAVPLWVMVPI